MVRRVEATDKDNRTGQEAEQMLERFEAEGYCFNPHTSAWARWIFSHGPSVLVTDILLTMAGTLIASLQTGLFQITYYNWHFPRSEYRWCRVSVDGQAMIYIYHVQPNTNYCFDLFNGFEPVAKTVNNSLGQDVVEELYYNAMRFQVPLSLSLLVALFIIRDFVRRAKIPAGIGKGRAVETA